MSTGTHDEGAIVRQLRQAHAAAAAAADELAQARRRRRTAAAQLHAAGWTYRRIGEELGVTAQAVEAFLKYRDRAGRKGRT